MARSGAASYQVLTACITASEQTTSKPEWQRLRPFAGGRVPRLAVGRAGNCRVGEVRHGCYHLGELAGEAVFESLLSPPCLPSLLPDRAVPIQGAAQRFEPAASVLCYLADRCAKLGPSTGCRLVSVYMSAKSRHRVLAVPRATAATILSA